MLTQALPRLCPAVTPSPPNLEPGRTIEPVSAGAKLLPSSSLPALPPASALQPAFPNESRTPPLQTPVIPSLPRAFPYGDLYPFIGYTGEPYPKPELEPAPNRPLNPPDIQLPSPVQTTAKPLEGAPVFPVRQKPPTSPKLSISPPTEYVPWTGKSLSPTASAEPLPNVKLDIKPLSIDGHDAPQNPGSTPLSLGAEQTSSVNAPSDTVSGRPLDQVGASGSALTPEGLKKSVQSRRTPFRTSPQEVTSPKMTSPVSSEPASPAHRRSIDEARAGVETLKRSPRDSFEGNVAGSGSALRPPDKDADRSSLSKRGTVGENERNDRNERYERNDRNDRNERNERSERTDRKLAEGTWALGGAELAPPGAGNSEHTFSMWLDDDKKMPAAGRRSAIGVNTGAAPVRAFAQPVLGNTPAPGTFYRGPVGKGPNEAGDTSPGPKVHGRTDSDVSVRTSEFEGGISSFAGSEARLDSPPRSPEPKLPEFHPPEKFVALFGGSFTPPRSSLTRGSPPPGLPLPPGARPLPPVSKEPSFGDALRERRPHSSEPSPPQEGATREGSVPPDLHFWPP